MDALEANTVPSWPDFLSKWYKPPPSSSSLSSSSSYPHQTVKQLRLVYNVSLIQWCWRESTGA